MVLYAEDFRTGSWWSSALAGRVWGVGPPEYEGDLWLWIPLPSRPWADLSSGLVKIPPIPAAKLDFVPTGLDSLFLRF